jgi:hypothetical protein
VTVNADETLAGGHEHFPIAGRRRKRGARPPDYSSAVPRSQLNPGVPLSRRHCFLSLGWETTNPNRLSHWELSFGSVTFRAARSGFWRDRRPAINTKRQPIGTVPTACRA